MSLNKRPRNDQDHDTASSADQRPASKPQLTRACAECKKHKIKCFVQPGAEACRKCQKSGIQCVPHNLKQKFIEEDTAWKSQASAQIDQLKAAVAQLLQQSNLPSLSGYQTNLGLSRQTIRDAPISPETACNYNTAGAVGNFTSEGSSALHRKDDSDLVPLPMNNLYSLTDPGKSRLILVDSSLVNGPDFISRGVVSLAEAEFLFAHFQSRINPLLWNGILCSHKTLATARESSSLLVATVLTVAALHMPNREQSLRATYDAFVMLMRDSCMLRSQNLDDIRGLCIGAFYLTSLSWALCSRAVRVATEMNLHKSSLQFARGSLASYERVRLWYVLYVCDHQFALAYGRPPMMHDCAAIRNADKLLTSELSSEGDRGLVAQVKLFRILAGCYFMYGCDADLELSGQDFEILQSLNIQLDQWRLEHQPKSVDTSRDPLLPSKGITLYYHLARFQLNSLSLRGISASRGPGGPAMNWERQEAANNAIAAATSTMRLLMIEDSQLRDAQIGMPIFVHAMIAVCASFLLKMAVVFCEPAGVNKALRLPRDLAKFGLNFHTESVLREVEALVGMLKAMADRASQQHVAGHVVTGLRELLQRFSPGPEPSTYLYPRGAESTGSAPGVHAQNSNSHASCDDAFVTGQADITSCGATITQLPGGQDSAWTQSMSLGHQQDPFDLLGGDLDWRFNDAFLLGIQTEDSYM
ncbi:uncharacterized protein L3040_009113 [Drepanopeziza brunnea f. sp. 'multigermtubi']|uniref:uncharacterized protein n=2 Tax=Drepanopeziza brunnea f. sp. 'multigermtubi' TaxID=698441 RepID=UPI00239792B1|nr:hypothetical protein L3040_009113 [Drepanopeziza brunnea f. sp. 'multigermtubi']